MSALIALPIAFAAPWAAAQSDLPPAGKPIRLVVTFPAGGAADLIGRAVGQKLSVALNTPVIVENRAGAAGAIGADYVAKAPPDGLTLVLGATSSHGTTPALNPKLGYDPVEDFSPIAMVAHNPIIFIVHPSVPARTLQEFVAYAKAKPGVPYGSNGIGSYNHLAVELFKMQAQFDMLHVPYKGAAPALADLAGGQIQFVATDLASAAAFIRTGKVRALGTATDKRVAGFEIPTVIESGYPKYLVNGWYSILGPKGMKPEMVARLHDILAKATMDQDFRDKLEVVGAIPVTSTPAQLRAYIQNEMTVWTTVIKIANIKSE